MTTQDRPLPPAAEAAFQLLTQNGPLSAHDLRELLRPQGYVQQIDRLLQWPDRFPHRFSVTADGRIAIANSGEKRLFAVEGVEVVGASVPG
ncbi:hypothetical protein [Mycolicibacterium smegmatis]|uniref:hypothetical protein n=1 Tax=Mycolicibacterium smegmatis TaxID=1772 RepID=UPI001EFBCD8F|nr:hypothetical protein [Mycolicibacterium smegmatis]ULN36428.1 hypothetical protein KZ781_05105 [Mycolicibacterium smegmatis]